MFKFLAAASVILALLFSAVPATADNYKYRDRDDHSKYEYRKEYHNSRYGWRNTYYDDSYEDFYSPLSRNRLIVELNNQGFYWVYNIRPSFRHNYVTAYAFDRPYGGRSVYLRVNQFNGHVFYYRYN